MNKKILFLLLPTAISVSAALKDTMFLSLLFAVLTAILALVLLKMFEGGGLGK